MNGRLKARETSRSKQLGIQSFFSASQFVKRRKLSSTIYSPHPSTPPTPSTFQFTPTTPPSAFVPQHDETPPSACAIGGRVTGSALVPKKGGKTQGEYRLRQMYLDLGQKDFGRQIVCKTCGMLYVHGIEEDAKQHKRICEHFQLGVAFHATQGRVVDSTAVGCIVEIRHSDCRALRKKVDQVQAIVDRDLGYLRTDRNNQNQRTTYFFVRHKRVVGMVSVEHISHAFVLTSSFERSTKKRNAMVGIHQLWVHAKHRKEGIARALIDTVRKTYIFGMVVPPEMVAFSSPTEAGTKFAQRYLQSTVGLKEATILVYDCG